MSLSDTLSVMGIAISVLFGLGGIYLAVRRAKYPASLTFVREQCLALLEDFAQKIPNLSILYKDTPIGKSVVLISGYVVNDGALDITREMTEEPLTCTLPDDSFWLEFKVTTSAPALHVTSVFVDMQNAKLDFGLFRRDESFSFQALVLLGDVHAKVKATDFADKLIWRHRIASLGEVKTVQMPPQPKRSKSALWARRGAFLLMGAGYAFFGISQMTGLGPLGKQPSIIHKALNAGKTATVRLIPNKDGKTTVKDLETGLGTAVNLHSYAKTTTLIPTWTDKRDSTWVSTFFGASMLLASVMFLYSGFGNEYRRYKLRKLVAASTQEN